MELAEAVFCVADPKVDLQTAFVLALDMAGAVLLALPVQLALLVEGAWTWQ